MKEYNRTVWACFIAYIVQAIGNNFPPLLFLMFHRSYSIPLEQITLLITINFLTQLIVDVLSIYVINVIGYRKSMILAHFSCAFGMVLIVTLPQMMNPFVGLLISVVMYAIGGGLLEVQVSEVIESCPSENKEKSMSMLHSFYCWGHVGVVLLSTLFFQLVGIEHWRILALAWAIVPLANGCNFFTTPMAPVLTQESHGLSLGQLLKNKTFWLMFVMMICAGASEQSVSQWASTFAEQGLNVSKTIGDLAGPMMFALCMGISRAYYGKFGERMNLNRFVLASCGLCILSYLMISLVPSSVIGLLGCALCGLSVGIMWPSTISRSVSLIPNGGTVMFALLALGGDIGCSSGPTVVGFVSGHFNDNLKLGILAAIVFPIVLLFGGWISKRTRRGKNEAKISEG